MPRPLQGGGHLSCWRRLLFLGPCDGGVALPGGSPWEPEVRESLTWAHSVPGSYAHALDGLYRVAREGERSRPLAWLDPGEGRAEGRGGHPASPFLRQRV